MADSAFEARQTALKDVRNVIEQALNTANLDERVNLIGEAHTRIFDVWAEELRIVRLSRHVRHSPIRHR